MDGSVHYDHVQTNDRYRMDHPIKIQFFRELDENGHFSRSMVEQQWADDYDFLLSHGYQLRPRFHPDWVPSWRGTDLPPVACEDSVEHFSAAVIDAKRIEDGKIVAIKRVPPFTLEAEIARMLSTPERLQDPMNHCVPIYDYFADDRNPLEGSFMVMPLLRDFNDPPFAYVDEVADFVRQMLEGLVYIHNQDIAHRDLSDGNIMMEGRALYGKDGFHPSDQNVTAGDIMIRTRPLTRKDVGFVKYYFTDFGLSKHFKDPSQPRLVTGNKAQDHDIPELSERIPYDPFPVDVFTLGMVFKRNFLEKYSNVEFLSDLCSSMTEKKSKKRPTALEALVIFQQSLSRCRGMALRWRLHTRHEPHLQRIIGDFRSAFKELVHQVKPPFKFLYTMIRAIIMFPFKVISLLLYYGPRRLIVYLRRSFGEPENQPTMD